ncbi:MAG: diacylglycerol kinase family lipid kinase [Firmicutes bacterium]|nr:diacylglycerol kinase family lipid kinase [Bacillota bacterium]
MRHAVLIYNPLSGRQRARRPVELDIARRILLEAGIAAETMPTRGRGSATHLARQAIAGGCELVICCGGDGTINEVVNGMAGSAVPLAVLPAGTANILAKELGIPWTITRAARLLAHCRPQRIALGQLKSQTGGAARFFVCTGGAGPDGVLVYSINEELKAHTGQGAYWWEGFRQLFRYRFPLFRVTAPELTGAQAVSMAIVGRTAHYGGPFQITTEASLFEDCFEVVLVQTRSRLRYLSYLPSITLHRLRRRGGVLFFKTRTLHCEPLGDDPVYTQVDGEAAGRLPSVFTIVPDALTLMVPEKAESWKL